MQIGKTNEDKAYLAGSIVLVVILVLISFPNILSFSMMSSDKYLYLSQVTRTSFVLMKDGNSNPIQNVQDQFVMLSSLEMADSTYHRPNNYLVVPNKDGTTSNTIRLYWEQKQGTDLIYVSGYSYCDYLEGSCSVFPYSNGVDFGDYVITLAKDVYQGGYFTASIKFKQSYFVIPEVPSSQVESDVLTLIRTIIQNTCNQNPNWCD